MSSKPSINHLKKFAGQSFQLNPKLQAVLGNLDVQLENELARYRRQRRVETQANSQVTSGRTSPRSNQSKDLELIVTPSSQERSSTQSSAQPFNGDRLDRESANGTLTEARGSTTFESNQSPSSPQTVLPENLDPSVSSKAESSLTPVNHDPEQHDEYLESSEQLLGSLDRPSPNNGSTHSRKRRRRRSLKQTIGPLTVGITLLLILGMGMLAHVLTGNLGNRKPTIADENSGSTSTGSPLPEVPRSPNLADKEFVPLDLDTLGTLSDNSPTPTPTPTPPSPPTTAQTETSATVPAMPDQNYPSLENLNTAILPQSVQDNPSISNPTDSSNADSSNADSSNADSSNSDSNNSDSSNADSSNADSSNSNTTSNDATNNSSGESTPNPSQPSQTQPETPTPLSPSTVSAQSFPAFFYVLIDYNSDDSLFLARQVVPDAYVREFPIGVRIQMGAFEDNGSAQQLVNYLKKQGIGAQVYQP